MATADPVIKKKIEPNMAIKPPSMYNVIYVDDNVTSVDFVTETLVSIFNYPASTAAEITMKIHEEGSAVVAVLPYELAEQKGVEVTVLARNNGYPLTVKLEIAD